LLYARRAASWRGWLALAAVLAIVHPLRLVPIVTPPIPPAAMLGFGLPMALAALLGLAVAEVVRRRTGETAGIFAFASATALLDGIGYRHTELGSWLATGSTQTEVLPLLQALSVAGLAGLGFLIAWAAALAASLLGAEGASRRWPHAVALGLTLLSVLQAGAIRLDRAGGRSVSVGAVVTDLGPGAGGLPGPDALAANVETLFERTRIAAGRGARLVVWNEVATLVEPAEEDALIARGQREARVLGVDIVLAYGVFVRHEPFLMDDKYVFVTSEGAVLDSYSKHHPVPGEPSVKGVGPARILDRPYARVAGMICYDGDFPAMGRERAGAEIVVVPASDWRGIDPIHTLMARQRAVENGYSLVRSTRWAASAGFDAYGRVRGWMQTTEDNDRVMVASVPVGRVATVYSALGDLPVAVAAAYLAVALGGSLRRRRAGSGG
ncbi:MAG: nitrilase-related carbon-nitrogen hydrolase, partial [Acidobacteriota bacterium]